MEAFNRIGHMEPLKRHSQAPMDILIVGSMKNIT